MLGQLIPIRNATIHEKYSCFILITYALMPVARSKVLGRGAPVSLWLVALAAAVVAGLKDRVLGVTNDIDASAHGRGDKRV